MVFVGLGIHDTNSAISEKVGAAAAMRWKADPLAWTHGPVFRPFLDHWCDAAAEATRRARSSAGASGADDASCGRDGERGGSSAAALPFPPLVWLTANEQCAKRKAAKWRYQAAVMAAANRASLDAAARYGVPILDWNRMLQSPAATGAAAAAAPGATSTDASDVCRLTLDGVHVPHWLDHTRASILLTYLCDEDGRWRMPCVRPERIARQCLSDEKARAEVRGASLR